MVTKRIDLHKLILDCPDFPKQGIIFRDISPVFRNIDALNYIADEFQSILNSYKFDTIVGIESRGFVVATVLALRFGKGLTMIRKAGKLPGETVRRSYDIEYGTAIMEIQRDAISDTQSVLIVDDLIAAGGTAEAAAQLIKEVGGRIAAFAFVIELSGLHGATKLRQMGHEVYSLAVYD
ncbi:MAG TPA: adenine phosphoribosyltransferase [Candidatus Nitrosopolaris sp.]|nr:adenine phosphoribosyltransferase [Candidatus Nitrosopolaris sp.]